MGSLLKNKNTFAFIPKNNLAFIQIYFGVGWFVLGFFMVAYLKYILLMAANETALCRIIGENSFLVIYVKIN